MQKPRSKEKLKTHILIAVIFPGVSALHNRVDRYRVQQFGLWVVYDFSFITTVLTWLRDIDS